MVKQFNLSDISHQRLALLAITAHKISLNKHTNLNQDFDTNLKVDIDVIKKLLETMEARVRKIEMIYYSTLESPDHSILTGNTSNLPLKQEFEFSYGTTVLKETIEINDKDAYKEMVNINFQQFILLVASLLENSVRLLKFL